LHRDTRREWAGSAFLLVHTLRNWTVLRVVTSLVAIIVAAFSEAGWPVALAIGASGELIGRYLFYVSVVPMNMPGSFSSGRTPR
jgi:hypothetical protein